MMRHNPLKRDLETLMLFVILAILVCTMTFFVDGYNKFLCTKYQYEKMITIVDWNKQDGCADYVYELMTNGSGFKLTFYDNDYQNGDGFLDTWVLTK